jgi:hypothetical protein
MSDNEKRRRSDLNAGSEEAVSAGAQPRRRVSTARRVPFVRLTLFYLGLIGVALLLTRFVPLVREAWIADPTVDVSNGLSKTDMLRSVQPLSQPAWGVLLITIGALALSLPIAWVYTYTRRLTYDASLVHSVIILPMVVSGIVVIVKDSVALAFSLAGIVAAVRFRNTLKDPKDAVYIFLAIGIGLAAGVQSLDVALVISVVFNAVVLVLWKYNIAAMYGETQRDILAVGDTQLMIARGLGERQAIARRVTREARDMDVDGILLVHAIDQEVAKQRVELTLGRVAEDWRIAENFRQSDGIQTFAVALRFKDDENDPLELLADIDERWPREIAAAEYLPYKQPAVKENKDESK